MISGIMFQAKCHMHVSSHGTFTQKKQNKHGRRLGYIWKKKKKQLLYKKEVWSICIITADDILREKVFVLERGDAV